MNLFDAQVLHFVTDLGDAILLLPASALVLANFLYFRSHAAAFAWAGTMALCIVLTIVAKLGFLACGGWVAGLHIHSPSGHTSLSFTFYAGTALAMASDKDRATRLLFAAGSIVLALGIAASRVLLQAHSTSEAVAGVVIGVACIGWYERQRRGDARPAVAWLPVLFGFLALALVLHGLHWSLEGPLTQVAHDYGPSFCHI